MKIILGLGNPGEKYKNTRHNVGFEFLDKLKQEWDFPDFELNKKFNSLVSKGSYKIQDTKYEILLVKPRTFMNLSGEAVRSILDFYKLSPEDILVVHDDKDILLGEFRLATDSSSAGHNGVQNIIDNLSTQKFKRLRIGVGAETNLPAEVFVLQKFSDEEKEKVEKVLEEVGEEIEKIL
ncbi:MAG TPA: aminoacyl-tRNA hydrolase [Candidatus Moranbacteria bacterium]|nr:aminoacyl-tRNA hydrolase [Candidatus Moranbacteria bacterium]